MRSTMQVLAHARRHGLPPATGCVSSGNLVQAVSSRFLSSKTDQEDIADVAIVGGGMVGAALAALLTSNPLTASMRIVLLDQKPQKSEWQPAAYPELRVSTITPASIRVMQEAGAWDLIEQHSPEVTTMQVWDASGSGCIRWQATDAGMEHMGVVAENSLLQASLLAAVRGCAYASTPPDATASPFPPGIPAVSKPGHPQAAVQCMWPATIKGLRLPPFDIHSQEAPMRAAASSDGSEVSGGSSIGIGCSSSSSVGGSQLATVLFEDDTELKARLVVAADGGASRIRQLAGFRTFGWKYHQRAVVATVQLEGGPTSTAWQRFLPTGPLALLPVRDGLANIVWSTTPEAAQALEQLSPSAFAAAVNKALQGSLPSGSPDQSSSPLDMRWLSSALGASSPLAKATESLLQHLPDSSQFQPPPMLQAWVGNQPKSFPLQLQHSGRYVRPRLALIGDAAHSVHPLAGQGVNLGFGDAKALADALVWGRSCGVDPGDLLVLQDQYERPRKTANLAMTAALDGLARTFQIQASPFAAARNVGLNLINIATPVRTALMRIAMGM